MNPASREWWRYAFKSARMGPTELGYRFFRGRRRAGNTGDDDGLAESDRLALSRVYDFTDAELAANAELMAAQAARGPEPIHSIQWFLPFFAHAYLGGTYTIMRFADHFHRHYGVESRFCIYDAPQRAVRDIEGRIAAAFPELAGSEVTTSIPPGRDGGKPFSHLRDADAAVATLWTSAYPLLRFNRTRAKYYFVQDFEPQFYPAGSASALAEETYRFGYHGIVNTPGLAEAYAEYGNPVVSFVPAVDTHRYHPPATPRPEEPVRIFFYGRPFTPRNAFGLGIAALCEVKRRYGDRVDIVCAGENWNPGQYGIAGRVRNLGRLSDMEEVAELYRRCHIGLVLMLTKHPSYQPFEFMASGVACVSNQNPHTEWFLRDGENALVAPPAPTPIANRIGRLVEDPALRGRIAETGLAQVREVDWADQIDGVWHALTGAPVSDAAA